MKQLKQLAIPVILLALLATSANAQTFKSDFATQLVLAGGGNDPIHSLTLTATAGAAPISLAFPNAASAASYVLVSDGAGHLTFSNAAAGVTLGGDVTGAANSNHIATIAGNDIVAAINAVTTTTPIVAPVALTANSLTAASGGAITTTGTVSGGTGTFTNLSTTTMTGTLNMGSNAISGTGAITGGAINGTSVNAGAGTIQTTGAVDGATGVFTSTLSAAGLTSSAGLTSTGGTNNLGVTDASNTNIGTGSHTNTIDIGNGNGTSGTFSTTNIAGLVNITGKITLPAGSVSPSSLTLGANHIFVGVGGNAQDDALTQDVSIADDGSAHAVATVNGSHAAIFAVNAAETVGTTLGVTGVTTTNGITNTGNVGTGTLSSTGLATLNSASVTTTLGVTGVTTTNGITNTGNVGTGTLSSTGLATLNSASVTTTLGVTGQTTLASTALGAVTLAAPAGAVLALGSASSYYILTDGGSAQTYNSITGANTSAGQVIVILNASTTPADYITLHSNGTFKLNGSDVIIGDGGAATLISDGTNWRLMSAE